jgi:glycosyltransferase involved in cell wall biosynthesis
MNQLRISIIIPVYNVEKYLPTCLDSVFSQDIPLSDYEVICVNDCSPDRSREIIVEYQKRCENIVLINHKVNSKQGAARNTGLKVAKGKYIWFVDSDDYIKENCLGRLLSVAEKDNLEILHFNTQKFDDNGKYKDFKYFPTETNVMTGYEFYEKNDYKNVTKEICVQLYKKDLLLNNDLLFVENTFYEDGLYTLKAMLLCDRFKSVKDKCYFYRKNSSSVTNTTIRNGSIMADLAIQIIERKHFIIKNYPKLKSVIAYCIDILKNIAIWKFWNLSGKERRIFINKMSNVDIKDLKKYFPWHIYSFYTNLCVFNIIAPIIHVFAQTIRRLKK